MISTGSYVEVLRSDIKIFSPSASAPSTYRRQRPQPEPGRVTDRILRVVRSSFQLLENRDPHLKRRCVRSQRGSDEDHDERIHPIHALHRGPTASR